MKIHAPLQASVLTFIVLKGPNDCTCCVQVARRKIKMASLPFHITGSITQHSTILHALISPMTHTSNTNHICICTPCLPPSKKETFCYALLEALCSADNLFK